MKQFIYDYICVNLPLKRVHQDGKCNPKMLKKLEELKGKENTEDNKETYAPFGNLDKLLKEQEKNKK